MRLENAVTVGVAAYNRYRFDEVEIFFPGGCRYNP